MQNLISVTTKPNDVVADFFMGSGATAEASCRLNRSFVGTELDAKYCEIARQRVKQAQIQGNLFAIT
jgi:site-specific DNA-methyltransferase (adenine-specific)